MCGQAGSESRASPVTPCPGPAQSPLAARAMADALSWGWTCARATGRSSFGRYRPQARLEASVSGVRGCFCSVRQVAMLGHRGGSAGLHTPRADTAGAVSPGRPCRRSHPVWCRRVSRVLLMSLGAERRALFSTKSCLDVLERARCFSLQLLNKRLELCRVRAFCLWFAGCCSSRLILKPV